MLKTLKKTLSLSAPKLALEIPPVIGAKDKPAFGKLVLHIPRGVTHFRFANTQGSLQFMPWEHVILQTREIHRTWSFMGVEGAGKPVYAEILYKDCGKRKSLILQGLENLRIAGNKQFPIDQLGWRNTSKFLLKHDFKEHAHEWASYNDSYNNVWYPMYWHPDGYAWNSHFERGPDKRESPVTCLAMHSYFGWYYPKLKFASLKEIDFTCELAFEGDLKGATAHFFVLITDRIDKHDEPLLSSGRYHQHNPTNLINLPANGEFATTNFRVNSEGWIPSYRRHGRSLTEKIKPELKYVEGFGIAFHNFEKDALPEGILKCRRWEFKF